MSKNFKKISVLILISLLSVISLALVVYGQPPSPAAMVFYGTVKIDGIDAPIGTIIKAYILNDSDPLMEDGNHTLIQVGNYSLLILNGTTDDINKSVNFTIDDRNAEQTGIFTLMGGTNLDLTFTSPPEIMITSKEFSRDSLACYRDTILKINLINTGNTSEKITLNVYNADLGYNQTNISVIDNNTTKEFFFNIDAINTTAGTKTFTFIIGYQYDYYTITDTINLSISDCFDVVSLENAITVQEDMAPAWRINLTEFTSGDTIGLVYFIESESNASLINCSINAQIFSCNTPAANASGTSKINMSITAGSTINYETFNVDVTPVNDPPYLINNLPDITFDEDSYNDSIDLDDYVSDIDNDKDELEWSVSGNSNVTVTIDAANVVTFGTANENWYGTETITFTVTDGQFNASQNILVNVTKLNDDLPSITSYSPTYDPRIGDGVVQNFNITIDDPDRIDPTVGWYVNDNLSQTGGTTFSYSALDDFTVKVNITNATTNNEHVWNVNVSTVPVTSS